MMLNQKLKLGLFEKEGFALLFFASLFRESYVNI